MKKLTILMAGLVLAAVPFLVQVNTASAADTARTAERLEGANRTLTAIAVAEKGWPNGAATVVLTRDDDFPDALAGAPLARMNDAPILLTNSLALSPETAQEIAKLHPTKIIILGSDDVVSTEIENTLKQSSKVERIGGKDRFETAAQIAQRVGNASGKVVIAYGMDYPDALAVSPWAAKNGVPILLSLTDTLTSYTYDALQQLKPSQTIVVGGSGVVSNAVASTLPNVERYSGTDRFKTAASIGKYLGQTDGTQLNPSNIFVATGMNWPDALAASALAGRDGNPIILALTRSALDPEEANYIFSHYAAVTKVTALGSVDVVPDSTVNQIVDGCYKEYLYDTYGHTSFGGTTLYWNKYDSFVETQSGPRLEIYVFCDNANWDSIKNNYPAELETYLTTIVKDAQKQYPNMVNSIRLFMATNRVRAAAYDWEGPVTVEFYP